MFDKTIEMWAGRVARHKREREERLSTLGLDLAIENMREVVYGCVAATLTLIALGLQALPLLDPYVLLLQVVMFCSAAVAMYYLLDGHLFMLERKAQKLKNQEDVGEDVAGG